MPHKQIAGIGLGEILYDSKLAKYNKCEWVITFSPTKLYNLTRSTTTVRTVFLKITYYRTRNRTKVFKILVSMYLCICRIFKIKHMKLIQYVGAHIQLQNWVTASLKYLRHALFTIYICI